MRQRRRHQQLRIATDADTLRVEGALTEDTAGVLWRALERAMSRGRTLTLDLSGVTHLGTAGAATLAEGSACARARGGALRISALKPEHEEVLARVVVVPAPEAVERPGPVERVGAAGFDFGTRLGRALRLVGEAIVLGVADLFRPGARGRFNETVRQADRFGTTAVPIVCLIALLLGLAMGFQAAYQLRQFGASIFIANLIGLSTVRELGPVITAIVVIGRSGSAITAELGTMVVREEVDALRVMGLDPVRYLVVPRLWAMTLSVPALTLFANVAGILGGLIIAGAYLDISPAAYVNQLLRAVKTWDVTIGLIKSVLFAWVIALVAVGYGLGPKAGPDSVGRATTASVVTAIFLMVLVDSTVTTLNTLWKD